MSEHLLVLGSNHRRARHLRLAWRHLQEGYDVRACTPPLRTRDGAAADGRGIVRYLNAAVRLRSTATPEALRAQMHAIEALAGRVRGDARVTLDIDVLASLQPDGTWQVHKPDDLRRDYVQRLLAKLELSLD